MYKNKRVHQESIFALSKFLPYPESIQNTYNKCLYSDYFRLVYSCVTRHINREK